MSIRTIQTSLWFARIGAVLGLIGMLAAIFILPVCAASSGGGFVLTGESIEANTSSESSGAGFVLNANSIPIASSFTNNPGPVVVTTPSGGGGFIFPSSSNTTTTTSTSTPSTGTTPASPPQEKAIYNVQILFITPTSAVISFDSTLPATSAVSFKSGKLTGSSGITQSLNYTHQHTLSNLTPNTTYTFSPFLTWADKSSNQYSNQTYTFKTNPSPAKEEKTTPTQKPTTDTNKPTTKPTTPQTKTQEKTLAAPQVPPTPPTNLIAIPKDKQTIQLTWQNPIQQTFKEVVIYRSLTNFPTGSVDGQEVYRGANQAFLDTQVDTQNPYYYTLFAVDNKGTISSGSPIKTNQLKAEEVLIDYNQATATEEKPTPQPQQTKVEPCTKQIPWPIFFLSFLVLTLSLLAWWYFKRRLHQEQNLLQTQNLNNQ